MSQLDLAGEAQISTRHLSFMETGRSVPSRGMVLTVTPWKRWLNSITER